MTDVEKVTKIEVARRQLRQAILLFLQREDTVSIHSLAAAAHQVLSDIATARGRATIIKNNPRLTPDQDLRREYYNRINEAFNFMKHADKDPDAVLQFRPKATPFYILDAILIYLELSEELPWEFNVFLAWYNMNFPDTIQDGPLKALVKRLIEEGLDPRDLDLLYQLARRGPI